MKVIIDKVQTGHSVTVRVSQFKTLDDVYNQTSGQYSTHKTTARVIEHRNGTLCEAATYRVGLS